MSKKQLYFAEAERLFVVEQHTINEIAQKLNLAEKTVRNWKKEGDWDHKKDQCLKQKTMFHEDLYVFARALMDSIRTDLDAGQKVDSGRMYTLARILPLITKVKDYEDAVTKVTESNKQSGLSDDVFGKIQEEIFGIR